MPSISFKQSEFPYSFTEEIKQLRTNIEYSGANTKVISLTSSTENEGKSTISYELCRSFAELGKRVLLIDADMRKSVLHTKIMPGQQKPRGLSYFLSGQSELANVLCSTDLPNFYCILAGRIPPNPSELLSSQRMKALIDWARERFDYVFFDCPPINLVVDASIVVSNSDGAIVVVKANSVHRREAQAVIKTIERTECPVIGVVLNQIKTNTKGYYKKYGYYGKGYGYGHRPDSKTSK